MNEQSKQVLLKLVDIVKEFPDRSGHGAVRAVDDVSLDIYDGEFLTLLGPSGCGKTTTLRLIAGFEIPNLGKILLEERDITQQPPNKRDMALVFQNYALFPHMSVYDNVAYGLQSQKMPRAQVKDKVTTSLSIIGLAGLEGRRPNQLSGGQQQRVALARSLVMEPRILLFDEPLSNLDAKLRVQMRSEIHRLQRSLGITSIYVTHDQVEAMALSDRIVVMNKGKIEQIGTPEEIYRYPKTRFVADFIGRANFLPATVSSTQNGSASLTVMGKQIDTRAPFEIEVGTVVTVMLRPEALTLRVDASLPQGVIEQAMYLGTEIEYMVRLDDIVITIVDNDPRKQHMFAEGETIGIDFIPEAVHLLPD
ncbi:MAG: ABC transporter ATP-binding protein [Anaerolineae bacterium]|nr:ABC transporter ATP-binding protein [Anaerolineae bacterium]